MQSAAAVVKHPNGLHARPAADFVMAAGVFVSEIQIRNLTTGSEWADAKSILGVLGLGVDSGHQVEISVDGPDEEEAITHLLTLV